MKLTSLEWWWCLKCSPSVWGDTVVVFSSSDCSLALTKPLKCCRLIVDQTVVHISLHPSVTISPACENKLRNYYQNIHKLLKEWHSLPKRMCLGGPVGSQISMFKCGFSYPELRVCFFFTYISRLFPVIWVNFTLCCVHPSEYFSFTTLRQQSSKTLW